MFGEDIPSSTQQKEQEKDKEEEEEDIPSSTQQKEQEQEEETEGKEEKEEEDPPLPLSETLESNEGSSQGTDDDKGNNNNSNDSSSSNQDLNSELNFRSTDALAKGISSMLGTVIRDFDSKAENAAQSQDHLSFAIDRLTGELDQLLEDAPLPFIMQHASKISGVRKRVSSLNFLLRSIQRRIDNIDRMLSTDLHEKAMAENSGQHQH